MKTNRKGFPVHPVLQPAPHGPVDARHPAVNPHGGPGDSAANERLTGTHRGDPRHQGNPPPHAGPFQGTPTEPEENWTPGGRGHGPGAFFGNVKQAGLLADDCNE